MPPVIKTDGEAEAKIIALVCGDPPEGRCRWTLRLVADKPVKMGILESITAMSICNLLKNDIQPYTFPFQLFFLILKIRSAFGNQLLVPLG
jgi:hypothetical protein